MPNTEQTVSDWKDKHVSQLVGTRNHFLFAARRCAFVCSTENIIGFQMQNTHTFFCCKHYLHFLWCCFFQSEDFLFSFHPFLSESLFYGLSVKDASKLCHVIGKHSKGFIARWFQIVWFYLHLNMLVCNKVFVFSSWKWWRFKIQVTLLVVKPKSVKFTPFLNWFNLPSNISTAPLIKVLIK